MKHFIIAKFKDPNDTLKYLADIRSIFEKTLEIPGVKSVAVYPSNSTRENRYSIMIEITMREEALPLYDASEPHKQWKAKYGEMIESKAIFDCEE